MLKTKKVYKKFGNVKNIFLSLYQKLQKRKKSCYAYISHHIARLCFACHWAAF